MMSEQAKHIMSSTGGVKVDNFKKDHGISSREIELNLENSQ